MPPELVPIAWRGHVGNIQLAELARSLVHLAPLITPTALALIPENTAPFCRHLFLFLRSVIADIA